MGEFRRIDKQRDPLLNILKWIVAVLAAMIVIALLFLHAVMGVETMKAARTPEAIKKFLRLMRIEENRPGDRREQGQIE